MANKNATVRSFKTSVDIAADSRTEVSRILNQRLADAFDLASQVEQAHWNINGPDFWQLHQLFDGSPNGPRSGPMRSRNA